MFSFSFLFFGEGGGGGGEGEEKKLFWVHRSSRSQLFFKIGVLKNFSQENNCVARPATLLK